MLYYIIIGAMGAAMAIILAALSRSNFYMVSGLVPLFPTFTMVAHLLAYKDGGVEQMKPVMLFGVYAIICYLSYLGTLYVGLNILKIKLSYSIILSLTVWLFIAYYVYQFKGRSY